LKLEISLEKLNSLQEKISILDKYDIKVDTKNGFKKVKAIGITSPNSEKIKIKTNNFELIGSPFHRVIKNENWIFLNQLSIEDLILTKNGYENIIEIEFDKDKEDLWDIEVDGEEYYSNGIVSHNSSLIGSFEYTLYGKSRGRSKKWSTLSTLPNRINNELLNKIKFNSSGIEIEIERGINPNILKLVENGVENKRAGKSNIDEKIENYIGIDIETFKSFISMSINDFKNFVSLSNEEKQLLLDKLFNLEIINILNDILKSIGKSNKNLILKFDSEISTLNDSISSIRRSIEKSIEKEKENLEEEINKIKKESESKKSEYVSLKDKCDKIKIKERELKEELDKEKEALSNIQNEIKNTDKDINLYNSGKCPVCKTTFESEHFENLKMSLNEKRKTLNNIKSEIESNITLLKERQSKLSLMSESTNNLFTDIVYLLKGYKTQIDKLEIQKNKEDGKSNQGVKEFENTIIELENKKEFSIGSSSICKDKELFYKELSKIFGEEGVKKSIISGIIKPINYFISENIKKMKLPFTVKLDETFSAEIKHLGTLVDHDSLSTGEQRKVSIAILMSYLSIIRTKHYINVLFLDEIFSSIDLEGIESILDLLRDFALEYKISIFVVHHAIMNQDKFDRIVKIEKDVFSKLVEIDPKSLQ